VDVIVIFHGVTGYDVPPLVAMCFGDSGLCQQAKQMKIVAVDSCIGSRSTIGELTLVPGFLGLIVFLNAVAHGSFPPRFWLFG